MQQANNALQQIAKINGQLSNTGLDSNTVVTLEDQRDQYVGQLAKLMDIRVSQGNNNEIIVTTSGGTQLVGDKASQLGFTRDRHAQRDAAVECRSDQERTGHHHSDVAVGYDH